MTHRPGGAPIHVRACVCMWACSEGACAEVSHRIRDRRETAHVAARDRVWQNLWAACSNSNVLQVLDNHLAAPEAEHHEAEQLHTQAVILESHALLRRAQISRPLLDLKITAHKACHLQQPTGFLRHVARHKLIKPKCGI